MTALCIRAEMAEPIVTYGDGTHFDGLLAYGAWMWLSQEERDAFPPISGPWAHDFELPLDRWERDGGLPAGVDPRITEDGKIKTRGEIQVGRVWGWKASVAVAEWIEGKNDVRKKPPIEDMVRYTEATSYNPGLGPMKSKDIPMPTRFARVVRWYAVGDKAEVERLLSRVVGVGKLAANGMGRVIRWIVEETSEVEGWAKRRIPVVEAEGAIFAGIRAPYHHPSRRVLCLEPNLG